MGVRNYLVEGLSCSGKTSVATELQRLGHHVVHGDRELAYKGDPLTGLPLEGPFDDALAGDVSFPRRHHLWCIKKVRAFMADQSHPVTFFCGGARNFSAFIGLFDKVFVLNLDRATLEKRLLFRPEDEFGGKPEKRAFILRLYDSEKDVPPDGIVIDATQPVAAVVAELLSHINIQPFRPL